MSGWRAMAATADDTHEFVPGFCNIADCFPLKEGIIHVYLAGPMTCQPAFGFPVFDSAAAWLREDGYKVISPHELDLAIGFDPDTDTPDEDFLTGAMRRDIEALLKVDIVVLLPGWEDSAGVATELGVARALGLPVYELVGKVLGRKAETNKEPAGPWVYAWSHLERLGRDEDDEGGETEGGTGWFAETPDEARVLKEWRSGDRLRVTCEGRPFRLGAQTTFPVSDTGGCKGKKAHQESHIPPDFILGLGEVYATAQANKYPDVEPGRPNWSQGYPWSLSYDACQRHLKAFWKGEFDDPEDGLAHLLHAAWHCATLYTWATEGIAPQFDDRPKYLRRRLEDKYVDQAEVDRVAEVRG